MESHFISICYNDRKTSECLTDIVLQELFLDEHMVHKIWINHIRQYSTVYTIMLYVVCTPNIRDRQINKNIILFGDDRMHAFLDIFLKKRMHAFLFYIISFWWW